MKKTIHNKMIITGATEDIDQFYHSHLSNLNTSRLSRYGIRDINSVFNQRIGNRIYMNWNSENVAENGIAFEIGCGYKNLQVRMIYLDSETKKRFKVGNPFSVEQMVFMNGRHRGNIQATANKWEDINYDYEHECAIESFFK